MLGFARRRGRAERLVEHQRQRYYFKNKLVSLYASFRLARNPQAVKYVFMIGDAQDNIAESERRLGRYPDPFRSGALEALWQSGYRAERYNLGELAELPPHTLGGAYARHMKGNGLQVDYYEEKTPRNRMQFLRQRLRQTHDIWHLLTGFSTDEFGEVGIQGFYAGQGLLNLAPIIGAGAIIKSIVRCRYIEAQKHMDSFCEGYMAGKRAESLLAVKWEELWGESVESLRRRYRIAVRQQDTAHVRELRAVA